MPHGNNGWPSPARGLRQKLARHAISFLEINMSVAQARGAALGASVTAGVTNTWVYAPLADGSQPANPSIVASTDVAAPQVDTDLQSSPNPGSLTGTTLPGADISSTLGKK